MMRAGTLRFLFLFLLLGTVAQADVVRVDVQVPWPHVWMDQQGYSHVAIDGYDFSSRPGSPALPGKALNVLIPPGHRVLSVGIDAGEAVELPGNHLIYPAQGPWVLRAGPPAFAPPDPEIYNDTPFPVAKIQSGELQTLRGFLLQPVVVVPFCYQPSSGALAFHPAVTVTVTTAPGSGIPVRGLDRDFARVRRLVANPGWIPLYMDHRTTGRDPDTRYVVVTSQALSDCPGPHNLQALITEKQDRGISAAIHTVEDIYPAYPGADDPEKIRNFIRDMYHNHGTGFVLLAGDADLELVGGETEPPIVPVRGLWGNVDHGGDELNIPSDLYYACLDGDFDANSNGIFGEPDDDPDLFAEVWTGRVPADSCAEIANFVRKTLAYRSAAGTWLKSVSFAGEILFPDVYAKDYLERIRHSSTDSGIDTLGFSESTFFETSTMYDADLGDNGWDWQQMIDILNSDVHIVNHLGHSYTNYHLRMFTDQLIGAMSNQRPFFQYGQGCYAGAFDNRTGPVESDGVVYPQDSFAEHMLLDAHGAFATVHYTRYGVVGPINMINRYFWDAAFRHGTTRLGEMHAYSLENLAGLVAEPRMRWQYYATTLFGDPELAFHLAPQTEPILGLSGGPVHFVAVSGEANPPDQSILVENLGEGLLNWSVAWDATWLSASPVSGTAPTSVALSVDAGGLTVGEHIAEITFSAPGALDAPQTLTVSLNLIGVPSAVAPFVAAAPVIDGIMSPGEYTGAVMLNLGLNPANPQSSTARLMHDGSYLYFALEIGDDTDVDAYDAVLLLFDNNHDGAWPAAPGEEGSVQIMNDNHAFRPYYNPGSGVETGAPVMGPAGVVGVVGGAVPRVVEATFDLGSGPLQVGPGDTFGMFVFAYDHLQGEEFQQVAYWPWNLDSIDNCESFGAVTIGTVDTNLIVDPGSLTFHAVEGGGPTAPVEVTVESSSGADLSFGMTSADAWIRISDTLGDTPDIIQVHADPAGVQAGPYIGAVEITAAGAGNSPVSLPVTFVVSEAPPAIGIEPTALFFVADAGGTLPAPKAITVTNAGGGQLYWVASSDDTWFGFTPASGTAPGSVSVTPGTTDLPTGSHVGTLTLTAPGADPVQVPLFYSIILHQCDTHADCDDQDPCTVDSCLDGACKHTPVEDCCLSADECDDEDPCTQDACEDGACVHAPGACCQTDTDCDDGDACTQDTCGQDQQCQHVDDGTCTGDSGCGCGGVYHPGVSRGGGSGHGPLGLIGLVLLALLGAGTCHPRRSLSE